MSDEDWAPPDPSPVTRAPDTGHRTDPTLPGYSQLVEVARGGDSVVYRARQDSVGRDVAIKIVRIDDPSSVARFQRELEITVRLGRQHPHIVTVLDTTTTSAGEPCLIMEFHDLGSLHDRLAAHGPLPVSEVVEAGTATADALAFAHAAGVLHRDVKPQNILVLPTSYVLSDFGIARRADSERTASLERFSYRHASPQILDGAVPNVADDVWSLGSTLFTLLEGRAPFSSDDRDDDTALAYLRRVRMGQRRPFTRDDLPAALRELVDGCLETDPARRVPTAAAALDALRAVRTEGRSWDPIAEPDAPPMTDAAAPVTDAAAAVTDAAAAATDAAAAAIARPAPEPAHGAESGSGLEPAARSGAEPTPGPAVAPAAGASGSAPVPGASGPIPAAGASGPPSGSAPASDASGSAPASTSDASDSAAAPDAPGSAADARASGFAPGTDASRPAPTPDTAAPAPTPASPASSPTRAKSAPTPPAPDTPAPETASGTPEPTPASGPGPAAASAPVARSALADLAPDDPRVRASDADAAPTAAGVTPPAEPPRDAPPPARRGSGWRRIAAFIGGMLIAGAAIGVGTALVQAANDPGDEPETTVTDDSVPTASSLPVESGAPQADVSDAQLAPKDLVVTDRGTSAQLTWSKPDRDVAFYVVVELSDDADPVALAHVAAGEAEYTVEGLDPDGTACFAVVGYATGDDGVDAGSSNKVCTR